MTCGCYLVTRTDSKKITHIPVTHDTPCYSIEEYNLTINNKEDWKSLNKQNVYTLDKKLYINVSDAEKIIDTTHYIGLTKYGKILRLTMSQYASMLGRPCDYTISPLNPKLQYRVDIKLNSEIEAKILYYKIQMEFNPTLCNVPKWVTEVS